MSRNAALQTLLLALLAAGAAAGTAAAGAMGTAAAGAMGTAAAGAMGQERGQERGQPRGAVGGLGEAQEGGLGDARMDAQDDGRTSRVDYDIRARLDGPSKRLVGEQTILWTNRTPDAVPDLWFHLYHNAFANNLSTHILESGGRLRDVDVHSRQPDEWGWQRVTRVVFEGTDVTSTFQHRWPASGNSEDRTVASVDLPRAVLPGETVRIDVSWEGQLPRVRRRTGYKDDFILAAHWIPKLGVYEAGRGWNAHPFHAFTEFYSNFGVYRVALDLPAAYVGKVGGTGKKVLDEVRRDRVEVVFEAPSRADRERLDVFGKQALVHGFAWAAHTAWRPDKRHPFRWSEWAAKYPEHVAAARRAFGEEAQLEGRDVDVTLLINPERRAQAARHAHATHAALFFYGLWFGEYPYEGITVVDPPWGARAAGGMEYPTLFTSGTRLGTTRDMHEPESVTVHEAGHQFFYGLIGNNEFEAAWLDEGINSYADAEVMKIVYGDERAATWYSSVAFDGVRPGPLPRSDRLGRALTAHDWSFRLPLPFLEDPRVDLQPLQGGGMIDFWRDQPLLTLVPRYTDPRWADRQGYLRDPDTDPIDTFAFEYADRTSFRTNSYARPAVMLRTLKGLIGQDAFLRGLRHFAAEWRYRHPYTDDFIQAFLEGSGADVQWFLEDALRSRKTIDWSVEVHQQRAAEPSGYFQESPTGPWRLIEPNAPPAARSSDEELGPGPTRSLPWRISILLRRKGELCLPLPWKVRYEDGQEELFEWKREEQLAGAWYRWSFESPRRVDAVILDPERLYYVDLDMSNNQWFREPSGLPALRWGASVLNQVQHLLHWYGGIGG
jgi:hypothetical protein